MRRNPLCEEFWLRITSKISYRKLNFLSSITRGIISSFSTWCSVNSSFMTSWYLCNILSITSQDVLNYVFVVSSIWSTHLHISNVNLPFELYYPLQFIFHAWMFYITFNFVCRIPIYILLLHVLEFLHFMPNYIQTLSMNIITTLFASHRTW